MLAKVLSCDLTVERWSITPAAKASSDQGSDQKERPMSTMSEASNYTGGSDYSTFPGSPPTHAPSTTFSSTSSTRVGLHQVLELC
ncbi:hypothetical protein F7725_021491 [Dissostichus mawsoni]|uniref:Uncharacterized protein n=1 Tax=Dissostichus mawsoni TaxID=36200 RepID=A0A7J5ZBB9_DISMA|nr:hypothetical protein F7725_021491 [Dissostichus mawsoni]